MGQFGSELDLDLQINAGIGHRLHYKANEICPILPSEVFSDTKEVKFEDLTLKLFHAPGETDDQIAVFIPEIKFLCPADNVYPHFPNLYPIRGAPTRSVSQWCESVKMMTSLESEYMTGCHGPVVRGRQEIKSRAYIKHFLRAYKTLLTDAGENVQKWTRLSSTRR